MVKVARDSALEVVVFNAIAGAIALAAILLFQGGLLPDFGFLLLLEAVGLMLIGGALDLSNTGSARAAVKQLRILFGAKIPEAGTEFTDEQRRKVGTTAATYALTGVLLFVEAGLLALFYI
jgi:hypothetical protein